MPYIISRGECIRSPLFFMLKIMLKASMGRVTRPAKGGGTPPFEKPDFTFPMPHHLKNHFHSIMKIL